MSPLANIKLPHWMIGLLTAAGILLPIVMKQQQLVGYQLPSWMLPTESVIIGTIGALGLGSSSAIPMVNVRAAMLHTAKLALVIVGVVWTVANLQACADTPSQVGVQVATVSLDAGMCVLKLETVVPPLSPAQIAIQCGIGALDCTVDPNSCLGASQVVQFLDAHKAAEVRETFIDAGAHE